MGDNGESRPFDGALKRRERLAQCQILQDQGLTGLEGREGGSYEVAQHAGDASPAGKKSQ
jgi:hypothetical protein